MPRRFFTLDVFTGDPLTGNPLAVVLDADDLDAARMQAIAGEFNLSETCVRPKARRTAAGADIQDPHPQARTALRGASTVGTAALLALLDQGGQPGAAAFGLKEQVGVVSCVAEIENGQAGHARFRLPRLPTRWSEEQVGRVMRGGAWSWPE